MVRLSLICVPKKESEDWFSEFQGLRGGGGSPSVFLDESRTGKGGGSTVGGERRGHEEEHGGLGMIARQSNCETGGAGEGGRKGSAWREGEEQMEGESGGETEGRRGFHGKPLRGLPLGRDMRFFS
jgi:hypothetical protein